MSKTLVYSFTISFIHKLYFGWVYFEQHRFQAIEIESTDAGLTEDDRMLSVETDFKTTMPDEQANSDLEEGTAIKETVLDEGLTDIDIEPI